MESKKTYPEISVLIRSRFKFQFSMVRSHEPVKIISSSIQKCTFYVLVRNEFQGACVLTWKRCVFCLLHPVHGPLVSQSKPGRLENDSFVILDGAENLCTYSNVMTSTKEISFS